MRKQQTPGKKNTAHVRPQEGPFPHRYERALRKMTDPRASMHNRQVSIVSTRCQLRPFFPRGCYSLDVWPTRCYVCAVVRRRSCAPSPPPPRLPTCLLLFCDARAVLSFFFSVSPGCREEEGQTCNQQSRSKSNNATLISFRLVTIDFCSLRLKCKKYPTYIVS